MSNPIILQFTEYQIYPIRLMIIRIHEFQCITCLGTKILEDVVALQIKNAE